MFRLLDNHKDHHWAFLVLRRLCARFQQPLKKVTESLDSAGASPSPWFANTHWSVVLAAAKGDPHAAQQALTTLCQTYWYPLYAYVRSRGFSPEDAEDTTQAFFCQLLEKGSFSRADRQRGKFRFFLLGALKKFLSDQLDKAMALKRGGGQKPISFDAQAAEERFKIEPVEALTPDRIFERRWGLTLLERAMLRLKAEYLAAGKQPLFEALEPFLSGAEDLPSYSRVAAGLGLTEAAVKSALHRLRQRHKEVLREEIAQTVTTAPEIEEEIHYLISVLSS
jgi:RNA polymerase sigma-70 factor (ECF subfamily)